MNKTTIPIVLFSMFLIFGLVFMLPGIGCLALCVFEQSFNSAPLIAGAAISLPGLIFSLIGGIGLYVIFHGKKRREVLKQTGTRISADYVETIINRNVHIQYRHPYNIICEWNNPADGKKYIFKSGNIWFNPENIIKESCISKFDVYYDENNIKNYTVDIDCLTKNVVDLS